MKQEFKELIVKEAEQLLRKAIEGHKLTKEEFELIIYANKIDSSNKNLFEQLIPIATNLLGGLM